MRSRARARSAAISLDTTRQAWRPHLAGALPWQRLYGLPNRISINWCMISSPLGLALSWAVIAVDRDMRLGACHEGADSDCHYCHDLYARRSIRRRCLLLLPARPDLPPRRWVQLIYRRPRARGYRR